MVFAAIASVAVSCGGGGGGPSAPTEMIDANYVLECCVVNKFHGVANATLCTANNNNVSGEVIATQDGRFRATFSINELGIQFDGLFTGSYIISGTNLTLRFDDGAVEQWTITEDRGRIRGTKNVQGWEIDLVYDRV
jgi:hypothetical protein